jgi:DNA-binding CsgD family transcriptional regulator
VAVARAAGAPEAELRAATVLGSDLAYLGDAERGLAQLREALVRAEEARDPLALQRAYVLVTDALTMLGRPAESARLGEAGLAAIDRFGVDRTVLVSNYLEALFSIGEWDDAERVSAAALRAIAGNYPYMLLINRAEIEIGRGEFEPARAHLDAAGLTLREDRGLGIYDVHVAELALWEHRWIDAEVAVQRGLAMAAPPQAAQIRVWLCAKGLRAQAESVALARARRDGAAVRRWHELAGQLITVAREAAATACAITPIADAWLSVAELEYERVCGGASARRWADAAQGWDRFQRAPSAAYCRWRQAEALVTAGASRHEAGVPLRRAHSVANRIGARPLQGEIEMLARRARLDLADPGAGACVKTAGLGAALGLTAREAEVLSLVACGRTNREIAATLVINVKTASVHVSNILRKLGVPNRLAAATIAHRLESSPDGDLPAPR